MNIANASPPATDPDSACFSFVRALSCGDLDLAAACFARDGCLITQDETAIHGRDRIRDVLAQMVIRHTEIQVELSSTIDAGEVILANQRWKIRSGEAGERRLVQTANALLVLRRIEAEWKLSIAAPWGCRHSFA